MDRAYQYDICIEIALRKYDDGAMDPLASGFLVEPLGDWLAGSDISIDDALSMARKLLEGRAARLIEELAWLYLQLNHQQQVLPFT